MNIRDAERLAISLMEQHGLRAVGLSMNHWQFRWDNAKRRNGICWYGRKVISLSCPLTLLRAEADVRNTILHEIAHALCGAGHNHDRVWQLKAIALGCSGTRCSEDGVQVPGKRVGTCPAGHIVHRYRDPRAGRLKSCAECKPYFSHEHLFTWRHR